MNVEDLLNDPDMLVLDSVGDAYKVPITKRVFNKPVVEYNLEGQFIASYNSTREASDATGLAQSTIGNICRGKFMHTRGLKGDIRIFLYRGDDIAERLQKIDKKKDEYLLLHPNITKNIEVCEYTLGGRFLFKYPTIKQAADINKVPVKVMSNCCKGKRLFIEKRIFMFPDGDIKQRVKEVKAELYRLSKKRPKYKPVDAYTLDGVFIKGFPSASAAGRELDVHVSDITRCCNGVDGYGKNCLTAKGRIFLWVGDSISDRLEQIKQLKQKKNVR